MSNLVIFTGQVWDARLDQPAKRLDKSGYSHRVLCWSPDIGHWVPGYYDFENGCWHSSHGDYSKIESVTHWSPLPPTPVN